MFKMIKKPLNKYKHQVQQLVKEIEEIFIKNEQLTKQNFVTALCFLINKHKTKNKIIKETVAVNQEILQIGRP